jgi:hypothetical protein
MNADSSIKSMDSKILAKELSIKTDSKYGKNFV